MNKIDIEQMKSSFRIEDVIGKTVKLEHRGGNLVGLCPFHDDHHPSLMVNVQKQVFNCFACGEHGDVIGFVEKTEHCSFMEAVGKLKIEKGELKTEKGEWKTVEKKAASINMNSDAKPFSTFNFQLSIEQNLRFLSSLMPFACGYSELTPAYLDFEVGKSQVVVPREWSAMRNRIIFPIRNEYGELIAFAGRSMGAGSVDKAKYINTSVANGYKKGEHLYALNRAKEAIVNQGFAFVVEGYKDAIAMHAAGFTNTVALSGTALTDGQIALLQQYTSCISLLLDGDRAGREAMRKITLSLDPVTTEVKTLFLPEGDDPDSLFRRLGKEAFAALIRKYQSEPHLSEELLLTACLLFADTYYQFKESPCLFPVLVKHILQTDELLFEDKGNREMLDLLGTGTLESGLRTGLKMQAKMLHEEYDREVYEEKQQFESLYPEASNQMDLYLSRLMFLYLENRILRDIQKNVRALLKTAPPDKDQRVKLLVHIARRREQLRHISHNLDRPGAIQL